jgi:hypothetical protein
MAITQRKLHCNTCSGNLTNHTLLHTDKEPWESEYDPDIRGSVTHEMLKCDGCGSVVLRRTEWCTEDHPEDSSPDTFFPPRTFRRTPKWLVDLRAADDVLTGLLNEVYVALQNDQLRLAAMGIRAVLEHIMISKVGDKGSFTKNIHAFEDAGHVSGIQRKHLEAILDVGHAAIHRGYSPTQGDLITLTDLTEVIVQTMYLHGDQVEALKKRVPSRMKPSPT